MRQWGIYLLIFGVGAFILPIVGLQFTILSVPTTRCWCHGCGRLRNGGPLLPPTRIGI
jgi:hypothetical protein